MSDPTTIQALYDEVERLTSQCARYAQERNMALNLNAARAQQLAQAWLEVDKARAAAEVRKIAEGRG